VLAALARRYETMLPSVLSARDRFLAPGGTMWPNKCNMLIEGVEDKRLDFWDDVYGIDMSVMKAEALKSLCGDAKVEAVDPKTVVTDRVEMWKCDLNTVKDEVRPARAKLGRERARRGGAAAIRRSWASERRLLLSVSRGLARRRRGCCCSYSSEAEAGRIVGLYPPFATN
jgi:hypothetical protein